MKINYRKILPSIAWLLPAVASAEDILGVPPVEVPEGGTVDLQYIITTVINWAFGLLILLAAVFIIIAAFMYLTSGGNEDKTKQAKNYITYAAVAILVGFLAKGIVTIVRNLIGSY